MQSSVQRFNNCMEFRGSGFQPCPLVIRLQLIATVIMATSNLLDGKGIKKKKNFTFYSGIKFSINNFLCLFV